VAYYVFFGGRLCSSRVDGLRVRREMGYNQQALYCYGKLYSLDPTNVDALWDRASLAKEMGDLRTVRTPNFNLMTIRHKSNTFTGPPLLPRDPQTLPARPNSPLRTPTSPD
jgi:hypothetical protein